MPVTNQKNMLQKIAHFFLIKMIVGIAVLVGLVALVEWVRSVLPGRTNLPGGTEALIVSVTEAGIATAAYIFLFSVYEKRPIYELSKINLKSYAFTGFLTGIGLQTFFILVIWLTGTFLIVNINPSSTLISSFAFALTAGFVAEIIMIGIVFRLLEEQTGTTIALVIFIIAFAALHVNVKGANVISIGATAMQAGLLLPAAYVYTRSLWFPVFLHFGWDFAEPGIFGGINPSTSLKQGLLTSKITGNSLFTGGATGPQDSLTSLLLCALLGIIFLALAKQKNVLIKPRWKTKSLPF